MIKSCYFTMQPTRLSMLCEKTLRLTLNHSYNHKIPRDYTKRVKHAMNHKSISNFRHECSIKGFICLSVCSCHYTNLILYL